VSYDLLFAVQRGKRFDAKRVSDHLKKRRHWAKQTDAQWLYRNGETGVYGVLDVGLSGDAEEALPAGFEPAALAANLNYARPSFFGHEFLPEVAWLAAALDLWIIDPQSEGLGAGIGPKRAVAADLVDCWERNNAAAVSALESGEHAELPRMGRDASLAAWRYMRAREAIQKQVGESVYACKVQFVRHKGSKNVLRYAAWVEGNPSVLPESDAVALVSLSRNGEPLPRGWIAMTDLIAGLGDSVTRRSFDVPGLPPLAIVTPQHAAIAAARAAALNMTPLGQFEGIGADGFIDVEPA
jgi:hypothetical protein